MSKKTVIWDLSGTLFSPCLEGIPPHEQGDFSLLRYIWSGKKEPSSLDARAYKLLEEVPVPQLRSSSVPITTHAGKRVPPLLCEYLAGTIRSSEALHRVLTYSANWQTDELLEPDRTHLLKMLRVLFDPFSLQRCMKPIDQTVSLFEKTVNHTNVFILSNWDHDSFIPFYEKYADTIFLNTPRSHILISADCGLIKPEKAFYRYLLDRHNLTPSECIFIDDQPDNIHAAQEEGIESFWYTPEHITELTDLLNRYHLV